MDWSGFRPPADWRQDGGGAKGPCPICRSTDGRRAWVRLYGSRWAAGCPSCNASTRELLPALGVRQQAAKRDPLERLRRKAAPRDPGQHATPATVLWSVATEHRVGDSPGVSVYLAGRIGGWPDGRPWPDVIGIVPWGRLRPDVEAVLGAHVNAPGSRPVPIPWELWRTGGRGAVIVYRFCAPLEDDVGAVQAEFVMQSADDVVRVELGGAKRRTVGETRGRAFVVDPTGPDPPDACWICEGPTTALAIAADNPQARVIAAGGELQHAVPHVRAWIPRADDPIVVAGEVGSLVMETVGLLRALYGARVRPPWAAPAGWPKGTDYADVRVQTWTS